MVSEAGPRKEETPVAEAQVLEAVLPGDGNSKEEVAEVPEVPLQVPENDDQEGNGPAVTNNAADSQYLQPEWTKCSLSLTWAASEKFASEKKGRLLTVEEAKSFLKKRGSAIYPGEDQWVAVIRKDGGKDWVQVGDKHHPVGKSHVDEGSGYPKWGDDSSGNPPFSRSVMWLPTANPASFTSVSSPKPQWKHGKSLTWHASKDSLHQPTVHKIRSAANVDT